MTTDYSAGAQALGYYYQVRYALLHILNGKEELKIAIERTDDIETVGASNLREMLQLKHHTSKNASLTNSSIDLWKTLRAWSDNLNNEKFSLSDTSLLLVTNAKAASNSIASFLCPNNKRDPKEAYNRIDQFLKTTKNQKIIDLAKVYSDTLTSKQKKQLVNSIFIIDLSHNIMEIPDAIKAMFITAHKKHHQAIYESIEGWWFDRVVTHLANQSSNFISKLEVQAKLSDINEQLKMDGLPSRFKDAMVPSEFDISDERRFVQQLRKIGVSDKRILHAIRDYYRAVQDRLFWMRTELIFDDDLNTYHQRLIEKWDEYVAITQDTFERTGGRLLEDADDDECRNFGEAIYNYICNLKIAIRQENPYEHITRGSYHILADEDPPHVWWHPRFMGVLELH